MMEKRNVTRIVRVQISGNASVEGEKFVREAKRLAFWHRSVVKPLKQKFKDFLDFSVDCGMPIATVLMYFILVCVCVCLAQSHIFLKRGDYILSHSVTRGRGVSQIRENTSTYFVNSP